MVGMGVVVLLSLVVVLRVAIFGRVSGAAMMMVAATAVITTRMTTMTTMPPLHAGTWCRLARTCTPSTRLIAGSPR
jgi:hypothetical protein